MKIAKFIVLLGVLGVSFSAIFVRFITAPSAVIAFLRMTIAAALLLPFLLLKYREELKSLSLKKILPCVISGICLAIHFSSYFEAVKNTSVAASTVLVDMEAFFVAISLPIFFHERLSVKSIFFILITFIGSIIVATSGSSGGQNTAYGNIMALIGGAAVAVYTLIGKQCRKTMSTSVYTWLVYSSSAFTLLFLCLFTSTPVSGYPLFDYIFCAALAIICTLMGHSVFSWGLKYVETSFISTTKLGEPVIATLLAAAFFGEAPGIRATVGGMAVITGIYLYIRHSHIIGTQSD